MQVWCASESFIPEIFHAADLCTTNLQETAKFKGRLFADPTRKLYHTLGMDIENLERTPKGQPRPSYLSLGPISDIMRSLWVSLSCLPSLHLLTFQHTNIQRGPIKNPSFIGKNGNISQLGGEFIFSPGRSFNNHNLFWLSPNTFE